jgi:anti-anti-sigma factor
MPEGHLTLGDGDRDLLDLIGRLLASGRRLLVLDLAGVEYLDAAGMGMLIRCQQRVAAMDGRLIVAGARSKVQEMLELAELEACLEQVVELDEAVSRLSAGEAANIPQDPQQRSRVA